MLYFRGLAPQNKPELQKVMEKRKRDQVIKQKEEEAQKKKSDLEIELLKRQQKLEQVGVPGVEVALCYWDIVDIQIYVCIESSKTREFQLRWDHRATACWS